MKLRAPAGHGAQGDPATARLGVHETLGRLFPSDWPEFIGEVGRQTALTYTRPENLSGLAGSLILPMVIFKRKAPLLPYLLVATAGWFAGRGCYQASRDLRDLAAAARAED